MSDARRRAEIEHQIGFLRGRPLRHVWDIVQAEIRKLPRSRWDLRSTGQSPVDFIREHYGALREGAWEPQGLTMADFDLDPKLRAAYRKWIRIHPEDRLPLPEAAPYVTALLASRRGEPR